MRGATPRKTLAVCIYNISIHAPYARSDLISMSVPPSTSFQSTLLMRGATSSASRSRTFSSISIHAPHARSDGACQRIQHGRSRISIHAPHARSDDHREDADPLYHDFNPRSSCEERHHLHRGHVLFPRFQSTLLMRGATCPVVPVPVTFVVISIHAPHARSDHPICRPSCRSTLHFNPRSSCEERQGSMYRH